MNKYNIRISKDKAHTLIIDFIFQINENEHLTLILPAWRPGRYELANFSENIENVHATENVKIKKTTRNSWSITSLISQSVTVSYEYYAHKMDAGNSWVDQNKIYINFINLLFYVKGKESEPCQVNLDFPKNYIVQSALGSHHNTLNSSSYYELVDSPLFASNTLHNYSYCVDNTNFELIIEGDYHPNQEVLNDFLAFTKAQTKLFGGFPNDNFKFMIQVLPYRHYHGVEHKNSTIITIGPDKDLQKRELYKELLGVSSHELFHCWNVTRIKPKEFIPYDFGRESYYDTGFITEGLTTYYGDLMLIRSKVFSTEEYLSELSKSIQRHIENPGRTKQSLLESSIDLWVDGYKNQAPFRGVSIYTKGLLAALLLDLKIILKSKGQQSLDNVMIDLWHQFGDSKNGYDKDLYTDIVSKYLGSDLTQEYMSNYIDGIVPIEVELKKLLLEFGISFLTSPSNNLFELHLGIKTIKSGTNHVIKKIHENSTVNTKLELEDIIIHSKIIQNQCHLVIIRNGKKMYLQLPIDDSKYYPKYNLIEDKNLTSSQEISKNFWLFRQ